MRRFVIRFTNRQHEQGFTLVEVVAAVALFAIIAISLLPIFPQMTKWSLATNDRMNVSYVLPVIIESIQQNVDMLELPVGDDSYAATLSHDELPMLDLNDSLGEPGLDYYITLDVQSEDVDGLYKAHVKVLDAEDTLRGDAYFYLRRS